MLACPARQQGERVFSHNRVIGAQTSELCTDGDCQGLGMMFLRFLLLKLPKTSPVQENGLLLMNFHEMIQQISN